MSKDNLVGKWFGLLFVLLAFFFLYKGTSMFYLGFHNVDLSHNFAKIGSDINSELAQYDVRLLSTDDTMDNTTGNTLISLTQGYKNGITMMLDSNIFFVLSGIFLAMGFMLIFLDWGKK